jgi:hypothetical protein
VHCLPKYESNKNPARKTTRALAVINSQDELKRKNEGNCAYIPTKHSILATVVLEELLLVVVLPKSGFICGGIAKLIIKKIN